MSDNPVYAIGSDGKPATVEAKPTYVNPNDGMDKEAFLKLLVAQLRYQDPMNPVQDRDFIAQMAQISSLEQSQNTARTERIGQAADLIGKQVEYLNNDKLAVLTAEVQKILIVDGEPQLVLAGKDPYDPTKEITATVGMDALRTILPAPKPASQTGTGTDGTDSASGSDAPASDSSASGSGQ